MEIYSVAKPKKRINIEKSVADQRKGDFIQKEILCPAGRLEDETETMKCQRSIIMKFFFI